MKRIIKLLKEIPILIAFRKHNTMQSITKPYSQTDKYKRSRLGHAVA
jgi:hypothetical protein